MKRYLLLLALCVAVLFGCGDSEEEAVPDTYKVYKITYTNGDIDTTVGKSVSEGFGYGSGYIEFTDTLGKNKKFGGIRRYEALKEYVIKEPNAIEPEFKLKNQTN